LLTSGQASKESIAANTKSHVWIDLPIDLHGAEHIDFRGVVLAQQGFPVGLCEGDVDGTQSVRNISILGDRKTTESKFSCELWSDYGRYDAVTLVLRATENCLLNALGSYISGGQCAMMEARR
jgi:hypothetical protein